VVTTIFQFQTDFPTKFEYEKQMFAISVKFCIKK